MPGALQGGTYDGEAPVSGLSPDLARRLRPLFGLAPSGGGTAVAVIRGNERSIACRGYSDRPGARPVRADTRFPLGSVTKTFTALLLADMVARGEVRYDDPIDRYLPAGTAPGYPYERPITLVHLATHTSGLPRLPVGLVPSAAPGWFTGPYATFSAPHLLRALPRTPVRGTPGTQVRYSNLGAGLLGLVLENAAGIRYEDLVAARINTPLGLIDTSCGAGREHGIGYRRGRRVPSFRIPALPGAAALHSTADDMLRYLQAHLSVDAVPIPDWTGAGPSLRAALGEVRVPRVTHRRDGSALGLMWGHRAFAGFSEGPSARPTDGASDGASDGSSDGARPSGEAVDGIPVGVPVGGELLHHSGSTKGFSAFVGFDPVAGVGLVAMANTMPGTGRTFARTAYETFCSLLPVQGGPIEPG